MGGLFALLSLAIRVVDRFGFAGLILLGVGAAFICANVPTAGVELFKFRMKGEGTPEQRAAILEEKRAFVAPLRFYKWCGMFLTNHRWCWVSGSSGLGRTATAENDMAAFDFCLPEPKMGQPADSFYHDMASVYHLIFDNWNLAMERQQAILSRLLPSPAAAGMVLDCACGIGTQALGLARAGYTVDGTDLSRAAVERAKIEAVARRLRIEFRVDDMRHLRTCPLGSFGVVLAFDNALPHLDSDEDVQMALAAMRDRLRPGGKLLISLRDYGPLIEQRPSMMPPAMFSDDGRRRIVHQVWDWQNERRYTVHLYITRQLLEGGWAVGHFVGHLRAITPQEVAGHAEHVGFQQVQVLLPAATGSGQPIVVAARP